MTSAEPRATLVAACYNHARYVTACLESIAAQTTTNFDLIVTDDASTDGSQELLAAELDRLGLTARTIFTTTNRGICATFNVALAEVRTSFVAFLSTDDVLAPNRMERQLQLFASLPDDVAFIYGDMPVIDDEGRLDGGHFYGARMGNRYRADRLGMYEELLRGNFIAAPSVMMRTEALRGVGGYDERLIYEDYDVWCRLAQHYRAATYDEPLVYYRRGVSESGGPSLSDDLMASRSGEYYLSTLRALSKHLGQSRHLDRIIAGRAYSYAMAAYKLGVRDQAIFAALRTQARVHPNPRDLALTLAAHLRLPLGRPIRSGAGS